jgi:glutamate synthase domain-containing protein 1
MGDREALLSSQQAIALARSLGLPFEERDACGMGVVAETTGVPGRRPLLWALESLDNLIHRGAVDADRRTFDGAGVLTQLPTALFSEALQAEGRSLPSDGRLGVAMVFLPQDPGQQAVARRIFEDQARARDVAPLLWRVVPVDPDVLGE